eukprot:GHVU01029939.1.p1 GENE.GHVU01029939.1~~GHVU01029939.1.p1  ORF type:complete len:444 (-),score=94.73 GHVU01029939.1:791-2122(-)
MSVSTEDDPGYNRFYGQRSVSQGGSDDSIIVRKRSTKVGGKGKTSAGIGGQAAAPAASGATKGVTGIAGLDGCLTPIVSCCGLSGRPPSQQQPDTGIDGGADPLVQNSPVVDWKPNYSKEFEDSDDPASSSGGTYDNIRAGQQAYVKPSNRGAGGVHESEKAASWTLALKKGDLPFALTPQQRQFAGLLFCLRAENSAKVTDRLLKEILYAASKMREDVDALQQLKTPEFGILKQVKVVRTKIVEEAFGDIHACLKAAVEPHGSAYAIVSKIRTVVLHSRYQGYALLVTAFDTGGFGQRGPACAGFAKLELLDDYLATVFGADPDVRRAAETPFSCVLLASKTVYGAASPQQEAWRNQGGAKHPSAAQRAALEQKKLTNPKYEAEVAYYHAVKGADPRAKENGIFYHEAGKGVRREHPELLEQQQRAAQLKKKVAPELQAKHR